MTTSQKFLEDFRLLMRVQKIFDRYNHSGHRPSYEEAKSWLESLGWKPHPMKNLLAQWGYPEAQG